MKASDFKPDDAVLYVPSHAHGDRRHPDCEHGVVRSQNGSNVFVRYWKNGVLQSTAQSTSPEDLVKGGEKLMTVAEEMAAAREKIAPPSHEELLKQARWMVLHPDTPASQRPMLMALLREIDLLELYRKGLSYDGNGHPHFDRAIAARAAEARIDRGDAVNLAMDWLENRPTLTPNGIQALCNAVMLMDKTLSSRPAIIEECARVCDEQYEKHKHYFSVGPGLATACATAIRALAPGGQNAAPQAGRKPCWFIERKEDPRWIEPWPSRNWTNDPLAARVFKSKADAELCIKEGQVYGSEAFATEHAWLDAPPAPAEVAEGAGEDDPIKEVQLLRRAHETDYINDGGHLADEQRDIQYSDMCALALSLATKLKLSSRPAIVEGWHGGTVESISEYFAKPCIVENLAAAHPVLLVRQMANEILRLRALAPGGQNAALPSGEFTNRKPEAHGEGPAVAAPDELDRHLEGEHHAIRAQSIDSPMNACSLKETCLWLKKIALSAPPTPAEVAEGAGEDLRKLALNLPVFDKNRNQFTVAMMQVAMEQAANCITDLLALRAAPSLSIDFDLLQTLQMRCNYIINGYSDAKLEAKEMGRLIGEALLAKVREAGK